MADCHPHAITFEGYECIFLENPLPCTRANKCKHIGGYCRSCDACGKTIEGPGYHCAKNGREWDFHPRCVHLETQICVDDVIFRLTKEGGPSKCLGCNKRLLQGASKSIPGWAYVSNHKGYNFHVNCVIVLLDMAKQHNTSSSSSSSSSTTSSSALTLSSLQHMSLQSKSKGSNNNGRINWLKVVQVFLKTVLAILIGDPTTILASTLAHLVTEGLFHAG